jgi:opacity protein-like surface antigen
MKKVILTIVAVFAFGFVNAQEVRFGVKAGVNFANLNYEMDGFSISPKSIVGVQVGGFAEIMVAEKFAVQPELLFSTEGAKVSSGGDSSTINLSYINIPVMAKFYPAESFSIEAGPQIGFLMSAKEKSDGEKQDVKNSVKSINFGVNFGAGYNFTDNLLVNLRYNLGLSDINDDKDLEGLKVKGSVFSVALGYRF